MIQGRPGSSLKNQMSNTANNALGKIFLLRQIYIPNVSKVHKDSVWLYSSSQWKILNVADPENTE